MIPSGVGGLAGLGVLGPNNIGHHQTMFFGPSHGFAQYSSLPRRSVAAGSAFQRNTPIRRSTGIPEHQLEYYVPRSMSEFNLSGVGDLALPPPRRCPPTVQHGIGMSGLHHGMQLGPPQTLICTAGPTPPPQIQIVMKPREKMVTFEDESKNHVPMTNTSVGMSVSGNNSTTHCPHGVPTTPRKSMSSSGLVGVVGGGGGSNGPGDVFM